MTLCCRCGKLRASQEIQVSTIGSELCAIYRLCTGCASFVGAAIRGDPLFSRGEQGREAHGVVRELLEGLKTFDEN